MRVNTSSGIAANAAATLNHEGTVVKVPTPEQELRRTVLSCMLWEDSFYESGDEAAARIADLIKRVGFVRVAAIAVEAREKMKLRHAPLHLARELARRSEGRKMGDLLKRIIQRPDEMAEFLALYWKDGRVPLTRQVKRGLGRAFRSFNEHQLGKYDRDDGIKLRDVLFLSHSKPLDATVRYTKAERKRAQDYELAPHEALYKRVVDRELAIPETWETSLSAGADKKATFTHLILDGKLGALAMLRNLRNMIESGVDDDVIRNGLAVMKVERVLPFRFITAAKYAPRFEPELEEAMYRCLADATKLQGRTALVVDTSPSMWQAKISAKSEMNRFEAAAALAILCREVCDDVGIYAFNEHAHEIAPRRGFALRDMLATTQGPASCGGLAVDMANARGYDRIIVLTDGQWHYSSRPGIKFDRDGDALTVSPAPLTRRAYMVNMAATKNGVGYGKWTAIDGWSEAIIEYIRACEGAA